MLYLFVGDDVVRAKEEALKRAKGYEVVRVGEGGESFGNVGGYLGQSGMFATKVALVLDRPLDSAEGKELLFEQGDALVDSASLVIAIVEDMTATEQKKLPKGAKVEMFETKIKTAEEVPPSVFALTDLYAAGDRKGSWVTYRKLIESGAQPEEVHGALAWAVRGMILAAKTKTAEEAGMKDYPYRKAKGAVQKIGIVAAENASRQLVQLYHDARMGKGALEDLLEVFLLKKQ